MYLEGWAFLCTCLCIKVKKTGYCEESPDGFSSNFDLGGLNWHFNNLDKGKCSQEMKFIDFTLLTPEDTMITFLNCSWKCLMDLD